MILHLICLCRQAATPLRTDTTHWSFRG